MKRETFTPEGLREGYEAARQEWQPKTPDNRSLEGMLRELELYGAPNPPKAVTERLEKLERLEYHLKPQAAADLTAVEMALGHAADSRRAADAADVLALVEDGAELEALDLDPDPVEVWTRKVEEARRRYQAIDQAAHIARRDLSAEFSASGPKYLAGLVEACELRGRPG